MLKQKFQSMHKNECYHSSRMKLYYFGMCVRKFCVFCFLAGLEHQMTLSRCKMLLEAKQWLCLIHHTLWTTLL